MTTHPLITKWIDRERSLRAAGSLGMADTLCVARREAQETLGLVWVPPPAPMSGTFPKNQGIDSPSFPEKLISHMDRQKLTRVELAKMLSVSLRTLGNWTSGEKEAHVLAQEGALARLDALPVSPLVQAAPELLAALKNCVGISKVRGGNLREYAALIKDCDALIARAEGAPPAEKEGAR